MQIFKRIFRRVRFAECNWFCGAADAVCNSSGWRGGWRSLLACDAWMGALQMHLAMSVWNKNASRNKGAKPD